MFLHFSQSLVIMIIPMIINDLINQINSVGFDFTLILKTKEDGAEPVVMGSLPLLEEVQRDVERKLSTPAPGPAQREADVATPTSGPAYSAGTKSEK